MRFWFLACLGSALASVISLPNTHELRLPFAPSPSHPESGFSSSLSIDWSIQNGNLYANQDQVYPPSTTMKLRAPIYDAEVLTDKIVELSYTIDSRPLAADQVGAVAGMVRVRVELLDLHGNLISPNAVSIDLLTYQDGNHHIARIHMEPAREGHRNDRFAQHSRPWAWKYWNKQLESEFEVKSHDHLGELSSTNLVPVERGSRFSLASLWAPPAPYPYRGHRHHHHHSSFSRIVRPIILPAVMGAVAGLVACLVGFFIGHMLMSLAMRLGWVAQLRSTTEGTASEKSPVLPRISAQDAMESV